MRFAIAFSTLSATARVTLHAASCRNAVRKPGLVVEQLPEGTTEKEAVERVRTDAAETGRQAVICRCTHYVPDGALPPSIREAR